MSKIDRRRVLVTTLGVTAAFVGLAEAQGPDTPNIALVKSLYAAFGKGDTATIVAAMAPDADWETVGRTSDFPTFGPRKGQPGVQEFFNLVGSNLELGVANAAMIHLAMATPGIGAEEFPCDILSPFFYEDDLLAEPLPIRAGSARPFERPGLGVELDPDKVRRYRVDI